MKRVSSLQMSVRVKNLALGLTIAAFVGSVYGYTLTRLGTVRRWVVNTSVLLFCNRMACFQSLARVSERVVECVWLCGRTTTAPASHRRAGRLPVLSMLLFMPRCRCHMKTGCGCVEAWLRRRVPSCPAVAGGVSCVPTVLPCVARCVSRWLDFCVGVSVALTRWKHTGVGECGVDDTSWSLPSCLRACADGCLSQDDVADVSRELEQGRGASGAVLVPVPAATAAAKPAPSTGK